jgi:hypothetical protein
MLCLPKASCNAEGWRTDGMRNLDEWVNFNG